MAHVKKKWVAFKGNLRIPAAMAGENADKKIQAGEPVNVPEFYADSVVQDGIAKHCDAPKKKAAGKTKTSTTSKPEPKKPEPKTPEPKSPAGPTAKQIAAAQKAVDDAQATLDGAADDAAKADAQIALSAAEDALAELTA